MRSLAPGATALTLVLAVTACSDALAPESIAGTYTASVFELTSVETPSKKEEWVAAGVKIGFVIGADGAFSITATWDETVAIDEAGSLLWQYSGFTEMGTIAIDGSTVTITLGVPCSGPISRSGDTLTWTLPGCFTRDFGDGREELATLRVVATRTS